mmetsp:Transcript_21502/g.54567  ORF Transcript_21502/g.54567 Transcript_21502/m.54567 type:complete len:111 (-) Transcript_21502:78-410(-)
MHRSCYRPPHDSSVCASILHAQGGVSVAYSLLYLRGRQVRWLEVPDQVDVLRTLQQREQRGKRSLQTFRSHKRRDKKREHGQAAVAKQPSAGTSDRDHRVVPMGTADRRS